MRQIVSVSHDVTAYLLDLLGDAWFAVKPSRTGPYTVGVVAADLQNRVTPISRYCRVRLQGWSETADKRTNYTAAFDFAAAAGAAIEAASGSGIILNAEIDSGPMRVSDPTSGRDFAYVTLILEVTA